MGYLDRFVDKCHKHGKTYAQAQIEETWNLVRIRARNDKVSAIKKQRNSLRAFQTFRMRDEEEARFCFIELLKAGIETKIISGRADIPGVYLQILVVEPTKEKSNGQGRVIETSNG